MAPRWMYIASVIAAVIIAMILALGSGFVADFSERPLPIACMEPKIYDEESQKCMCPECYIESTVDNDNVSPCLKDPQCIPNDAPGICEINPNNPSCIDYDDGECSGNDCPDPPPEP